MHNSVREIRQRLLALLGRAFVVVLLFILLIFLTVVGFFVSSDFSPMRRFFPQSLQGYYLGHGSWEGVEAVFERDDELNQIPIVLLDEEQRVILAILDEITDLWEPKLRAGKLDTGVQSK